LAVDKSLGSHFRNRVFKERPIKQFPGKSFLGEAVYERLVRRKSWPLG
jgi:hypothetical protein